MRTILNHHLAPAQVADHIRYLIRNLYGFQLLLSRFNRLVQVRIEVADNGLPGHSTVCHFIQQRFHVSCKVRVHDAWEGILHDAVYHIPQLRYIEVLALLYHISSGNDRGNGGSIGTWTAYALLLQRLYQGRLRVVCRRLGEMLAWVQLFQL